MLHNNRPLSISFPPLYLIYNHLYPEPANPYLTTSHRDPTKSGTSRQLAIYTYVPAYILDVCLQCGTAILSSYISCRHPECNRQTNIETHFASPGGGCSSSLVFNARCNIACRLCAISSLISALLTKLPFHSPKFQTPTQKATRYGERKLSYTFRRSLSEISVPGIQFHE